MHTLKPLIAMQLKDKINASNKHSWKVVLFRIIFAIIKFALITTVIYVGFSILSILRLIDLTSGIPDKFLGLIFTLMMILSIITCTIGLVKTLYFAKDNQLLLTLPTNRENIFFSKIVVFYLYECLKNITYFLPLFIALGMINGYAFYFYIWIIIALIWVTALSVMLGALLSIPAMYIAIFFQNFKALQYIVIVTLLTLGVWGVIYIISLIPNNFNMIESWGTTFWKIQDFLNDFEKIFIPFYWVLESVVGNRYGVSHTMFYKEQWFCVLGVLGAIALLIGLCYLVVRPLYFHIASSPFEYKKVSIKNKKKNIKINSFWSAVNKEILIIFRTPEKLYSLLGVAIGMPIAILLLNKIFNAMDTRITGAYMAVTFNMLMILLFALSSNVTSARIYSEEGNSSYLIKTNPKPYAKSLVAKLIPNAIVMTFSILATVIVYSQFSMKFVSIPLMFLTIILLYIGHLLWSAELDFMNPQNSFYATTGTHTNNPNEIKSTIYAFVISIITAGFTFFLLNENFKTFWIKALLLALIFCGFRIYSYFTKIKVYYKEI